MPLPPAPSRRADMLDPKAFAAAAPQKNKTSHARKAAIAQATLDAPAPTAAVATAPAARPENRARKTAGAQPPFSASGTTESATSSLAPEPVASAARGSAKPAKSGKKPHSGGGGGSGVKLFVLDTNVLLHDPMAMFHFEEHDIFLPMVVLEELDAHKKGMTEVARNGRQTSRQLDALAAARGADMAQGLPLAATGHIEATGKLYFQTEPLEAASLSTLPKGKADNQILGVVAALEQRRAKTPASHQQVVLVSKDINMRVKARALGLAAEDYENDKTLEDGDLLYSGALALPGDFWTRQSKTIESWQSGTSTFYRVSGPIVRTLMLNQFVYFEAAGEPGLHARVTEIRDKTAVLKTLKDYTHAKNTVWGVNARNREQNFALNLLLDPEIDVVTLAGTAGTGKTLLALAAGLQQVLDERRYTEIIMTRATVNMGEDIGFLPGTEEEKMSPWMGALDDNLEFLTKGDNSSAGEWGRAATTELVRSRIKIKSMNFMRGRTFLNKWVILDEAQNLTPKQIKTLITRAGPGTKIICMGNLSQIDTPYLTEGSSGLTYAVDRFKGWSHAGHITLARGERSRLADFASDVL